MRFFQLRRLLLASILLTLPLSLTSTSANAAERDEPTKAKEYNKKKQPSKYRALPKREREKIRKVHENYNKMSPDKQRRLREEWKKQKQKKRK